MIASRALCLKITKNVAFEKSPKSAFLGIFNELLATQNVNVARFARNVALNETFSMIFKHRAMFQGLHFANNIFPVAFS